METRISCDDVIERVNNVDGKRMGLISKEANVTELEVAELIVSVLNLEFAPQDIQPDEVLFVDGLGLDSIDALELAFEISKRYGIEIKADDEDTRAIFGSLRALTNYINRNRGS